MKYDNINEILFPKEEKVTIGSLLGEDILNSIIDFCGFSEYSFRLYTHKSYRPWFSLP